MTPLALRRFPDTIVRRREAEGRRNAYGEWTPGEVTDIELRAAVQPLELADDNLAGGAQLIQMLKVFTPPIYERVGTARAILTVHGEPLTLMGAPLTLGLGSETFDRASVTAAFVSAGADRVVWGGFTYVVIESRAWASHVRATLLLET